MEENGNMSCGCNKSTSSATVSTNYSNAYVNYIQAKELFMNRFSLGQIDYDESREELIPYYTAIVQYLNYRLTILGSDDMKTMLCEVFDIFDEGSDAISQVPDYKEILKDIIDNEDYDSIDGHITYIVNAHKEGGNKEHWEEADTLYEQYTGEWPEECKVFENATEWAEELGVTIPECGLERDRFILAWGHAMTAICMRLRFQYAHLFDQEEDDSDCCGCCSNGQTTDDYESWVSNVYSNDEEYDRTNYTRATSAWQVSKSRVCDCYRRHNGTSSAADNDEDGENVSLS